MSERTVVAGTRRSYKELVDGTLRVQIDIDPMYKPDFLRLFPGIDMPVAIAPLGLDAPIAQPAEHRPRKAEEPRSSRGGGAPESWKNLGPLAQSAILICKEPAFRMFVADRITLATAESTEEEAANYIKERCQITSRKELDTDDGGRERFGALMAEYREWRG